MFLLFQFQGGRVLGRSFGLRVGNPPVVRALNINPRYNLCSNEEVILAHLTQLESRTIEADHQVQMEQYVHQLIALLIHNKYSFQ